MNPSAIPSNCSAYQEAQAPITQALAEQHVVKLMREKEERGDIDGKMFFAMFEMMAEIDNPEFDVETYLSNLITD